MKDAIFAAAMAVIFVLVIILAFTDNDHQERSEQHWRDVEHCQELDGTIVYGRGQWFKECVVLP